MSDAQAPNLGIRIAVDQRLAHFECFVSNFKVPRLDIDCQEAPVICRLDDRPDFVLVNFRAEAREFVFSVTRLSFRHGRRPFWEFRLSPRIIYWTHAESDTSPKRQRGTLLLPSLTLRASMAHQ